MQSDSRRSFFNRREHKVSAIIELCQRVISGDNRNIYAFYLPLHLCASAVKKPRIGL
ncbi:MAG: hypothetical protein RLZZ262_895 [Bacteroidota bacterium]|jgi:hypothetical protein